MSPKFNINRQKISDDEINKHKDFNRLVDQFKKQSLKKAQGDESWWQNKKIRYSTVIAGITVICTITYLSLFTNQKKHTQKNETLITQKNTKNSSAKNPFIQQPSQKIKIPYTAYTINNNTGGVIKHKEGSKINIPKQSFIDKSGKEIVGDVIIEYKEFHDLGDVIVSGIPMAYDSAGIKYNLESAGMFDIRGYQNGEPVFIKDDKTIEVELASKNDENRFNQYYLDTLAKNWRYLKKDNINALNNSKQSSKSLSSIHKNTEDAEKKSTKLQALKNQIEIVIPKKIDSVKTLCAKKITQLAKAKEPFKPAKSNPNRPTFKLEGSYDEFPELAAFNNVVFEVGSENKNYSNEFQEITWSDLKVSQGPIKGKNYLLNLIYRNRSEKLIVYPVLTGADFDKAEKLYTQQLQTYQNLVTKRQQDEKRLLDEMEAKQATYMAEQKKKEEEYKTERAKLFAKYNVSEQNEIATNFKNMSNDVKATRLFKVSNFGIYNSDCPHAEPQGKAVSPIFVLNNNGKFISPDFIYLINHQTKSVYALSKQDGFKITVNPENTYSICIFNKNQVYICQKNKFQESIENASNKFIITPLPDNSDNLIDFKKALEI